MITGNEPAMPIKGADDRFFSCSNKQEYEDWALQTNPSIGLTKREYFAAMAMQGILSNSHFMEHHSDVDIHSLSVNNADHLIAELNK